jgi:hypothetical protein
MILSVIVRSLFFCVPRAAKQTNAVSVKKIKIEPQEIETNSKYFSSDASNNLVDLNNNNIELDESEPGRNIKIKKLLEPIKLLEVKSEPNILEEPQRKKGKWEPPNWLKQLERIREMRSDQNAPVDTMGCDALSSLDPNVSEKVFIFFRKLNKTKMLYLFKN